MTSLRTAFLGTALILALGSGVRAQGDSGSQQLTDFQLMNGRVIVVTPAGRVAMRPGNGAGMLSDAMKDAQPMTGGSILFMRDNRLYAIPDRPMGSGTMLSDMVTRQAG